MKIQLRIGSLWLQEGSNNDGCYHVVHPVDEAQEYTPGVTTVCTVAFITLGKECCDMRTVGHRPWEMQDTTTAQFMTFCDVAMRLLEELRRAAEESNG